MNNRLYDTLKLISLLAIDAVATFVLTVGQIWGIPYYEAIATTVTAFGVLIGSVVATTSKVYHSKDEGSDEDGV